MAKLSDLVSRSSEVTGVPIATVREISRRLREGELIRTGKGGRYGGADMTPRDAASLLTALLIVRASAVSLSDIVPLTRSHLSGLKSPGRWGRQLALPQLCRLKPRHTFGEAFSALIASISNRELESSITKWALDRPRGFAPFFELTVKIVSPFSEARIEFRSPAFDVLDMVYLRPRDQAAFLPLPRKWSDVPEDEAFDLRVSATLQEPTLKSIGLLLKNSDAKHAAF
jgi:hypothetical protein